MSRIFVDSSVLYSGLASSSGTARDLLLQGESGTVNLVYSDTVIDEVERNLSRKIPPALAYFHLVQASGTLEYTEPPQALVDECRDLTHLKDAAIIAAAIHSDCKWIATFDEKHLLSARAAILARYDITTARPDEILESLGLRSRS